MKLIVEEIIQSKTLYQEITASENIDVIAIRPRIYKHLAPVGTLQIKITDASGNIIAISNSVTITDINSANYSHTYYKFDIATQLFSGNTYRIYIYNSGYTFSESAWCGWCRTLDLGRVDCDYSPCIGMDSPFDFELWQKRRF